MKTARNGCRKMEEARVLLRSERNHWTGLQQFCLSASLHTRGSSPDDALHPHLQLVLVPLHRHSGIALLSGSRWQKWGPWTFLWLALDAVTSFPLPRLRRVQAVLGDPYGGIHYSPDAHTLRGNRAGAIWTPGSPGSIMRRYGHRGEPSHGVD